MCVEGRVCVGRVQGRGGALVLSSRTVWGVRHEHVQTDGVVIWVSGLNMN